MGGLNKIKGMILLLMLYTPPQHRIWTACSLQDANLEQPKQSHLS